jgi:hypothetical protein
MHLRVRHLIISNHSDCISKRSTNKCSCDSLEQPCNKCPVEPVAALLASVFELLLRLVGHKCLLLAVDLVLAGVEVSLVRLDALGLHEELVAKNADEVNRNTLRSMSVFSLVDIGQRSKLTR